MRTVRYKAASIPGHTARRRPRTMPRGARALSPLASEEGLVLVAVLSIAVVLTMLAALIMFVAGKETALSGLRFTGSESLYIAEGGASQARAALMAYMGVYPTGIVTVDSSLTTTAANNWYANGIAAAQNPFGVLDYLDLDGQHFTLGATSATTSETFQVNWGLGNTHLKLQTGGTPSNPLGKGSYTASVTLTPNPTPDASCVGGPCAVHTVGTNAYEIFYNYAVTSISNVPPFARRQVNLTGSFSVTVQGQSFAQYALFTNTHTSPGGNPVWFATPTSFTGPVYTNGEFRFNHFPTFTSTLQSASANAWFNNNGSPLELANTENVQNGTRIDAPLVPPDPNPQSATPAAFTLGTPTVPFPTGPYNQQGVAIGLSPGNSNQVTTSQIDAAIPELKNTNSVPTGVYVPVADTNGNCRSDANNPMAGGIYVQGDVDSMTMSLAGPTNNQAVYTIVQGGIGTTTTITVDRNANTSTVSMTGAGGINKWPLPSTLGGCPGVPQGPAARTFTGVPKGWQQPGNANATIIYVNGQILSLSGTLQQNEQTTIAASGTITIQGNIQYQTAPNPSDPASNPTNLLGLFSSGGDIVIGTSAPNDVVIQGVLMAGSTGSSYNSSVTVANYNSGSARGAVHLLGGVVEAYYGPFGTTNGSTQLTGYGRSFVYDTRMSRGFSPPYFPGAGSFQIAQGSQAMAGVRPTWRESTPP